VQAPQFTTRGMCVLAGSAALPGGLAPGGGSVQTAVFGGQWQEAQLIAAWPVMIAGWAAGRWQIWCR
jgi:hypothetical protein